MALLVGKNGQGACELEVQNQTGGGGEADGLTWIAGRTATVQQSSNSQRLAAHQQVERKARITIRAVEGRGANELVPEGTLRSWSRTARQRYESHQSVFS